MADNLIDKVPPQDLDAEAAILGAILLHPEAADEVAQSLKPDMFYKKANSLIYETLLTLRNQGKPLDQIILKGELQTRGLLEEVGGVSYIAELVDAVPSAANAAYYANIVSEKSLLRNLISTSAEIQNEAFSSVESTDKILDSAEQRFFAVTQRRISTSAQPISVAITEVFDHLRNMREGTNKRGIPSGFGLLDDMTHGFHPGELTILAARPSMGKTSLALSFIRNMCLYEGKAAAFFSLEMPQLQVAANLICNVAQVDSRQLRGGYVRRDDEVRLMDAAELLSEARIYIDDCPALSTMELRAKGRRLKAQYDINAIVIDYLQLMTGSGNSRDGRQVEVSEISRMLKALARELDIPVISLAQLSRKVEERPDHKPRMSDLRESGCLTGDSMITLADSGERVPIRDLVGKDGFHVWALNTETYKIEKAKVSRSFSTGTKKVFRLTTALGKSIRATGNHKFFTIEGWKRLDELEEREHLALPRSLEQPDQATISESELALLGHLIGDGCTLPRRTIQYTTRETDLAELVSNLAKQVFDSEVAPHQKRERDWIQVYIPTTRKITHGVRNPVSVWIEEFGLWGKRSYEKFVPEKVFKQPRASIAVFLRHLWATDGCIRLRKVSERHYPAVYYASSSQKLASDVQALLLRLDIRSRLKRVPQKAKGRDQYHVVLSGREDLLAFAERVGAVGEYKCQALRELVQHLESREANTNRDVIPKSVWQNEVVPILQDVGMSQRHFQSKLGMSYCGMTLYKTNLSRERAGRVAEVIDSTALKSLSESEVYWDRITQIEEDGVEEVFDLTVPGPHNFVANDLIVHNSIEQDADVILLLYRAEYYRPEDESVKGLGQIVVSKNRNGPTGEVNVGFQRQYTRFDNLSDQPT